MREQDKKNEIDNLLRRQPEAIENWFRRYVDTVYTYVYYKVGMNNEIAEDIVQDTFLEAMGSIEQYDSNRADMAGWLILLSRNSIRKALRNRNKFVINCENVRPGSKILEFCKNLSSQKLPDEIVENQETAQLVQVALVNLPTHFAQALTNRYYHGHSIRQMADAGKVSEGSVKVLLHRARKAFEKAFIKLDGNLQVLSSKIGENNE